MKSSHSSEFACRHCRYYQPQGRRGGICQKLNVLVQGGWKACALAIPPFEPTWQSLEEVLAEGITTWQQEAIRTMQITEVEPSLTTHISDPEPMPRSPLTQPV